ncbi:hypothetical protein P886_0498 [Alteromonadaceae bacterium 2753L.S.0a.02]|nr:hypothetical protein P886_0498 [Alteromonadaceae bacterium 2753L.S.0a.02]
MKVYQISFDLRQQRSYQALFKLLQSYANWARPLESCWVIVTNKSTGEVRDDLAKVVDADDGLLVARLWGEAAWQKLNGDAANHMTDWLKQYLNQPV